MRKYCMIGLMALVVAAVAVPAVQTLTSGKAVVLAADDGDEGGLKDRTLLDAVWDGGFTELLIILLSIVGMALVIEHLVTIQRAKLVPPHLLNEIENLFEEEEYEEAMDLCDGEQNFLCHVVGAGLSKIGAGYERILMAVSDASEEEATTLHQKISYLSLIANIAPMMGLLGTVLGMIEAFNTIASMGGAANPADLAHGISQALITTCTGLIVAIPILVFYMFFRNRVVKVVQEVEGITNELMDRFRQPE